MSDRSLGLLVELAKLVRKYGPDEFERLARNIASPELADSLASLLNTVADAERKRHRSRPASGDEQGLSRRQLLKTIRAQLDSPSDLDVRALAEKLGEPPPRDARRSDMVRIVLKRLEGMPEHDLEGILKEISLAGRNDTEGDDQGLRGWSKLILGEGKEGGGRATG